MKIFLLVLELPASNMVSFDFVVIKSSVFFPYRTNPPPIEFKEFIVVEVTLLDVSSAKKVDNSKSEQFQIRISVENELQSNAARDV